MYNQQWGGLPSQQFLRQLDPALAAVAERFAKPALTADQQAGGLTEEVARKVGLPPGVAVAVGAFDAHMGAVGAGIKPGTLVKIIGTSTCDMMVAPLDKSLPDIPGLCGIVPGSIIPGMYGLEAGQSAVGDIFNWFVKYLTPAAYTAKGDPHAHLTREAEQLRPGESGLLALDWNNGNRTILVDPLLTGLLVGQTLHTTAPEIYRALVEATAFGGPDDHQPLRGIRRGGQRGCQLRRHRRKESVCDADLCRRLQSADEDQPLAADLRLGAAMFGAVAGGAYKTVQQAQRKMTGVKDHVYRPNRAAAKTYSELYRLYRRLHDAFGTPNGDGQLHGVMKDLIALREPGPPGGSLMLGGVEEGSVRGEPRIGPHRASRP